ncbi:MAG: ribonucleoside-diphosphate reductase subunit alpha [Gammaproteobacteria bacterium AqS3]|nr:ribonucleoside-diphosphate reductase subunit alpha [Gammaproteobacteria bacterium AqS3]
MSERETITADELPQKQEQNISEAELLAGGGSEHQRAYPDYSPGAIRVIKRNGKVVPFDAERIRLAIMKAFLEVDGVAAAESGRIIEIVTRHTNTVVASVRRSRPSGGTIHIEDIQDKVEVTLSRADRPDVAREYMFYREERASKRKEHQDQNQQAELPVEDNNLFSQFAEKSIHVQYPDGSTQPLNTADLERLIVEACTGLEGAEPRAVLEALMSDFYDGMREQDVDQAMIIAMRPMVEIDPIYRRVTARLLLHRLRKMVLASFDMNPVVTHAQMRECYAEAFRRYLPFGIEAGMLNPELQEYDIDALAEGLIPDNDLNFTYHGLQTLSDRYLLHQGYVSGSEGQQKNIYEMPQFLFMRVAMGLALREPERERRALEFYRLLSSLDYMCSTPTLFNSGTNHSQLSSCYLTTVPDDLGGIYGAIRDNALLSKWAGGLGNDWTPVRALGANIRSTNGESQGVVPFLKVVNDTAVAVNQGGKRKGAVCAYLETWHLDIESFLELRKNTGDERRRTHDMNTANWIPDLFMQRVMQQGQWTLFSPDTVPDLHDLYGSAFAERYQEYEAMADRGEIAPTRRVEAVKLWRRMLESLYETGHPWITFKDACNIRSPQRHAGVIHSSNLCTEITLNTASGEDAEIAVCNLGSINIARHVGIQGIDREKLAQTVRTAVRMLDNVIDINYYAVEAAERSNMRHRPVGLGLMGLQDALYIQRIPVASEDAVKFSDQLMEAISYHAISASCDLAEERGAYETFEGSLWSQGVLPIDSLRLLADSRGAEHLEISADASMDWQPLRERVRQIGMRNSNVMAIAPTATIANIVGVSASIEPTYEHLYTKSDMSGEFTTVNEYLVAELKQQGIWDKVMIEDLKYYRQLSKINRIPDDLRTLYATAFEISPEWLIRAAAHRQKWIDQSQSLNLYIDAQNDGSMISRAYEMAWLTGLKTTYYLRTLGASDIEQATVSRRDDSSSTPDPTPEPVQVDVAAPDLGSIQPACSIDDTDCEACQ